MELSAQAPRAAEHKAGSPAAGGLHSLCCRHLTPFVSVLSFFGVWERITGNWHLWLILLSLPLTHYPNLYCQLFTLGFAFSKMCEHGNLYCNLGRTQFLHFFRFLIFQGRSLIFYWDGYFIFFNFTICGLLSFSFFLCRFAIMISKYLIF